ncbi:universal stress protein [Roseateles sp. DC23W]|uniref:Universal stress protein n=1 Tax=Pelomonas dachongensis TaxID=3299029 RepID=A0ABW7EQR4_9BURK
MPSSILIVTDFSQAAEFAAQRAVLLARQHGRELLVAHLAGSGPPDVAERLPRYAAMLARRHRLSVRVLGSLAPPYLRQAAAAQAGLLVMGWPPPAAGRFPWSASLLALRLLWRQPCPLLVVRHPASRPYARLLVALGTSPAPATALLRAATALAPRAALELFHVIDSRHEGQLRAAQATTQALRAYRRMLDEQGRRHLQRLSDVLDARRNRLMYTLGRGDPARQILVQQEHGDAELVIAGRSRRPAWLELLLGSTAGRLLRHMRCDLLIWPWPERAAPLPCQNPVHARNRLGTSR